MNKLTSASTVKEVKREVVRIHNICEQYDFWDRDVHPYAWRMTVRELVESNGWRDYERYTESSKSIIRQEINGFAEILESWVAFQNEPKISIHYIDGAKKGLTESIQQSLADLFIQTGLAELA